MTHQETIHIIWLIVQMLFIAIYFAFNMVNTLYIHLHEEETGLLREYPLSIINSVLSCMIYVSLNYNLNSIETFKQWENEDWLFLIKPACSVGIMLVLFGGWRLSVYLLVHIFKSKFQAKPSNNT